MSHNDQAFITKRASEFEAALNSHDVDKALSFYSKDIKFSDHVMYIENYDYEQYKGFLGFMFTGVSDLKMTTKATSGTEAFTAQEVTFNFVAKDDIEPLSVKAGEHTVLKGVSLCHWKQEGGAWKIFKEDDYCSVDRSGHKK